MAYTITVYTTFKKQSKDSTFTIEVPTETQVNDHVREIFKSGYRRLRDNNTIDWFPPHMIARVKVTSTENLKGYKDQDIT